MLVREGFSLYAHGNMMVYEPRYAYFAYASYGPAGLG